MFLELEAASDFERILARVRAGTEVVIDNAFAPAVSLRVASDPPSGGFRNRCAWPRNTLLWQRWIVALPLTSKLQSQVIPSRTELHGIDVVSLKQWV